MKRIQIYINIAFILLISLWVFAAGSKLADFSKFKNEMYNQVFPGSVATALLYMVPAVEIIAVGLLCFIKTRFAGFVLSALLMLSFSIYIGLALFQVYSRMPCSCAGVLEYMGWGANFIFNLAFTAVAVAGTILTYKRGRDVTAMKSE